MKISLKYLNSYIDISTLPLKTLVDTITVSAVEIEETEKLASGDHLVIGYVEECLLHPDSNHLHVCQVNIGTGIVSIVCGAPNVAKGQKVIVALPGANLPAKGLVIQKGVIRGVPSEGMICSLLELGVDDKYLNEEQKAGIEVLDHEAPVGNSNPLAYLGLDDTLLVLKPTPNRGDVLSMLSFVYEASAVLNKPLKKDFEKPSLPKLEKPTYTVKTITAKCPRIALRAVHGVKTKPSPKWLKEVLIGMGVRSINNIVDIGNFVMLLLGQPLHMYDADKLVCHDFVVKEGFSGDFVALDESVYQLTPDDILITDGDQIGCLAGVMGSNGTKVDDKTTNLVIEAAEFNPIQIRTTARRLDLLSEAATRFIRGIDYTRCQDALDLAAEMLIKLADASSVEEIISAGDFTLKNTTIDLPLSKINKVLGTNITLVEVKAVFDRLRFSYTSQGEVLTVKVPSYRSDITIPEDLIEEVIRISGFDRIKENYPVDSVNGAYSPRQHKRRLIREHLVANGLHEALTYTLENKKYNEDFKLMNCNKKAEPIHVLQPLTEDKEYLRQSLIPALLRTVNYNNSRGNEDVNLCELSMMYYNHDQEHEHLAIVLTGALKNVKWQKPNASDFYTIKGLATSVLDLLGIEDTRYSLEKVEEGNPNLHSGRSAYLVSGKKVFGYIGEIHPLMEKKYEVKKCVVCEIDLDFLFSLQTSKLKFVTPSIYPTVSRDIALVVKKDVACGDLIKIIKKNGKQIVSKAEVFDVYQGDNLEAGYKSVAINIAYSDSTKTLKEEDVVSVHSGIVKALEKAFDAKLRS